MKDRWRKVWNACWSTPLEDRIRHWQAYIRGWSAYFGVCDSRWQVQALEGLKRRHKRKYFWQRWHHRQGRLNALRRLKARPYHLKQASGSVGAWRKARSPMRQTVLDKARLHRWGLYVPFDLTAT